MIVGNLILDEDELVAGYVAEKIGCAPFTNYRTIGVMYRGAFVGGCVGHNYIEHEGTPIAMEFSAAFEHAGWCRRGILRSLFSYVFLDAKVVRLDASAARKNKRVRRLLLGLGFREEGTRRKRWDGKDDLVMYGMLREQCRWITKD